MQTESLLANTRILMIGNFVSATHGTKPYCESLADQLERVGFSVIRSSSQARRLPRAAARAVTALIQDYDACHIDVFSGRAFIWAAMAARIAHARSKPIVLALHGGGLADFARRDSGRVGRLLRAADVVVTPSKTLRDAMCGLRGDIRVIPDGIELDDFAWRERKACRAELVWVRAFHRMYEPWVAVQVLAQLSQDYPEAHLTFVGPDKGDGSLERTIALVKKSGLESRVVFRGALPHSDVPGLLSQHDFFLNTTSIESFGISVIEAAASGLIIVTTDAGELQNLWTHRVDAMVVSVGDVRGMTQAVRDVLEKPQLARDLSANARRRAEAFDWHTVVPMWEAVYAEALSRG